MICLYSAPPLPSYWHAGSLHVFPIVRGAPHPIYANQREAILLGELGGLEGSPVNEVLTTDVLCSDVKSVADRLPE